MYISLLNLIFMEELKLFLIICPLENKDLSGKRFSELN